MKIEDVIDLKNGGRIIIDGIVDNHRFVLYISTLNYKYIIIEYNGKIYYRKFIGSYILSPALYRGEAQDPKYIYSGKIVDLFEKVIKILKVVTDDV